MTYQNNTQRERLDSFSLLLLANGFTVIKPKNALYLWLYFFKDGAFGYVGASSTLDWLSFSTVHKPCANYGTGIGVGEVETPTIALAERCLLNQWPYNKVIKYKTLEEKLASLWFEYDLLTPKTE